MSFRNLILPVIFSLQLLTCITIQTCIMNSTAFCPHCNSTLWKEERKHRLNCCNNGKCTIPALKPVPPELMNIFTCKEFQTAQRGYNGLFSFTALGAGGVDKIIWTQPIRGPSMLTLRGKGYHRIFDLQQQYDCLLYTSPSPRDQRGSRMPSSA